MINTHTVSKALHDQISAYQPVKDFDPIITLGEFVNVDPSRTPWIGVFRDKVSDTPRTLGHNTWNTTLTLKVIVQAASMESGEDCQTLLDSYVKETRAAILSDLTFGNSVLHTSQLDTEFNYVDTERESFYYQSAVISIQCEGRSNV